MDIKELISYFIIIRIDYDCRRNHFSFHIILDKSIGGNLDKGNIYIYFSKEKKLNVTSEDENIFNFLLEIINRNSISEIELEINNYLKNTVLDLISTFYKSFYNFVKMSTLSLSKDYELSLFLSDYCFLKDSVICFDKNKRIKYLLDSKNYKMASYINEIFIFIEQYNCLRDFIYEQGIIKHIELTKEI